MIKNKNVEENCINGFTADEICKLYKYVCDYENKIKDYPTCFDIMTKDIEKIKNENDLFFETLSKKHLGKAHRHKYYILFEQNKNSKASKYDKAHHLLRHIRNSIAHGKIKKQEGGLVILKDNNLMRETMVGKIPSKIMSKLITALVNSRKKNNY